MKTNKKISSLIYKTAYLLVFLFLCFLPYSNAQRKIKKSGIKAYENQEYQIAKDIFYQYPKTNKNPKLLYYRAVSNYHCNNIDQTIQDLIASFRLGNNNREIFWYLGLCLQDQKKYNLAISKFKSFLRSNPKDIKRLKAIKHIKECTFGLQSMKKEILGALNPLPKSINSDYDEMNPRYSIHDRSSIYFSSNFKDDKFNIYKAASFINKYNIIPSDSLNEHILMCFNEAGSKMFFQQKINDISHFVIKEYTQDSPYYFNSPADITKGDKDIVFFRDSVMLFVSNRTGGYGGDDIYFCIYQNGTWSKAINMGYPINTKSNESSPFLCNDGQKLFYSSNRTNGFGGYDIYSNTFNVYLGQWNASNNLNTPINSNLDDKNYSLSIDGKYGLFSSNRKSSVGGFDIYKVKLKELELSQKAQNSIWFILFY